jgi:hypothetical protein
VARRRIDRSELHGRIVTALIPAGRGSIPADESGVAGDQESRQRPAESGNYPAPLHRRSRPRCRHPHGDRDLALAQLSMLQMFVVVST